MKRINVVSSKVPEIFKKGLENISCLRRGEINGKSTDDKKLNEKQTYILIIKWLQSDRDSFLKLLSFKYNKDWEYLRNG